MFARIVLRSFFRQKRRKTIVLAAVALGTAAAAALGDIALDVGDKMSRELKSFGANLVLLPEGGAAPVMVGGEDVSGLRIASYLEYSDLPKVKVNFWKNNILAFAPALDVPAKVAGQGVLMRGTWFERSFSVSADGTAPATAPSARPERGRSVRPSPRGLRKMSGRAGADFAKNPTEPERTSTTSPRPSEGGDGEAFLTGVRSANPYWSIRGRWPDDRTQEAREAGAADVVVGRALADALGLHPESPVEIEVAGRVSSFIVAGILTAGGEEEGAVLVPIETAWRVSGLNGRVSRIFVRALTTPESAVYERLGLDPRGASPTASNRARADFETWICTPFVSSIAYELARAVPGADVKVIRRVADSEGTILRRTSGLIVLIALMAALGSALTVTSALGTSVLERRSEIGLLKAMGAGTPRVVGLFVAEAATLGLVGGLLGTGAGALIARWISASVFDAPVDIRPASLPLGIAAALAITLAGCILPVRRIMRLRPFEVLRGL